MAEYPIASVVEETREKIVLRQDDLRRLLDGEIVEGWAGCIVDISLDDKIGPFELGVLVGISLKAREIIADAERRLQGRVDGADGNGNT